MPYWVNNTFFQPFNDTANYYGRTNRNLTVSGGIDTKPIDNFREGVNLRTIGDIYNTMQLKIVFEDGSQAMEVNPNGELTHESSFITYGQAGDFIQFTCNPAFNDQIAGIEGTILNGNSRLSRTALYLQQTAGLVEGTISSEEVFPIYLNGGPQFQKETIVEPLTIPERLQTNESPQELVTGIYAFLEIGNYGDERRYGNSILEQMQYRNRLTTARAFLEFDSNYILFTGSNGSVSSSVDIKPNAIFGPTVYSKIEPWLDQPLGAFFPDLLNATDLLSVPVTTSAGIIQPFYSNNYEITDSNLQTRDQKSATAGFTYYGGNSSLYGTDSIAFGGYYRGT
jgi:hypothetical protein